jgi:hypothetical protein
MPHPFFSQFRTLVLQIRLSKAAVEALVAASASAARVARITRIAASTTNAALHSNYDTVGLMPRLDGS